MSAVSNMTLIEILRNWRFCEPEDSRQMLLYPYLWNTCISQDFQYLLQRKKNYFKIVKVELSLMNSINTTHLCHPATMRVIFLPEPNSRTRHDWRFQQWFWLLLKVERSFTWRLPTDPFVWNKRYALRSQNTKWILMYCLEYRFASKGLQFVARLFNDFCVNIYTLTTC